MQVSKGVLGISLWRELQMTHDILAVRYRFVCMLLYHEFNYLILADF